MSTFTHTYDCTAMLEAVAELVKDIEQPDSGDMEVHTISLVLNGQHGEFDLLVEATDENLDDHAWAAVAYRNGGVDDIRKVKTP